MRHPPTTVRVPRRIHVIAIGAILTVILLIGTALRTSRSSTPKLEINPDQSVAAITTAPHNEPIPVLVAARDLRTGDILDETTVTVVNRPPDESPEGALRSLEGLDGYVVATSLPAHAAIVRASLGRAVATTGLRPPVLTSFDLIEPLLRQRLTPYRLHPAHGHVQRGDRVILLTAQAQPLPLPLGEGRVVRATKDETEISAPSSQQLEEYLAAGQVRFQRYERVGPLQVARAIAKTRRE